MTDGTYSFENLKKDIDIEVEKCRKSEEYFKDGRGIRNWEGGIRYHSERAYNGLCRGDLTREKYDEIQAMLKAVVIA